MLARGRRSDSTNTASNRDPPWIRRKREVILEACRWRNLSSLRSLAESPGGLIDDRLRRAACACRTVSLHALPVLTLTPIARSGPILLGVSSSEPVIDGQPKQLQADASLGVDWRELPRHREENQVQLDVNRSFIFYPNGTQVTSLDDALAFRQPS